MKLPALLMALFLVSACGEESKETTVDPKKGDPDMQTWTDAKFGMFIHWGVYSYLGGIWQGEAIDGYGEHVLKVLKIPLETYKKEVAANFNPTKFDAESWVQLCKDAGMKYLIITAKHHDGFAMFDSEITKYDVVDATPFARDPMKELKKACEQQGIMFGFYYSQAQDWSHPYGQGNIVDYPNHPMEEHWHEMKRYQKHLENSKIYVYEKAIPQVRELITTYDPDILWFDTPGWLPDEYNAQIAAVARELKPNLIINSRGAKGYENYRSTSDKPVAFPPRDGYWEAIPTTNESYGYHRMDRSHKPSGYFIRLLAKASYRGGNLLLNVGPMGTGEIEPIDEKILRGIGDWLRVNGESIYGSQRSPLSAQTWGVSTLKGNKLYLHVFDWPDDGQLVVGGLISDIERAWLLTDPENTLDMQRKSAYDWAVTVPSEAPDTVNSVIVIQVKDQVEVRPERLLLATAPHDLHVYDGNLVSESLRFDKGKADRNHVRKWRSTEEYVYWPVRLAGPAQFHMTVVYKASKAMGGVFTVEIGDMSLEKAVVPSQEYQSTALGRVAIPAGEHILAVKAKAITGDELMNLKSIQLVPIEE